MAVCSGIAEALNIIIFTCSQAQLMTILYNIGLWIYASEPDSLMRNIRTHFQNAADELKRYSIASHLQFRFHLNIRFRFRILTADDGFPKFRV